MDKTAKIYVAGHKGMVGSAIHRYLLAQDYTNIIARTSSELDLTNQLATDKFFEENKPEYVFLAAAKVGGIMGNSLYRAEYIFNNLQIQNNVVGACHKHGVKKMLFLGSSCIYPKNAPQPITEDSLLTSGLEFTNEPYAIAKIAGIKLIESFNIQYGTNYLAVQPTNLYGPNDTFDLEKGHAFPMILRKFILAHMLELKDFAGLQKDLDVDKSDADIIAQLEGYGIFTDGSKVTVKLWGSGKPYREFLHVDDMAEASVYVMNHVDFSNLSDGMSEIKNTQINVGTGNDVTIKDFAYMIKEAIEYEGKVEFDHTKPDGTMRKLLDVTRLNNLGWHSKINLDSGLKDTLKWYLESKNA
jgi:GDP-L-fucose synthase